jgi:hypothetical protein
LPHTIQISQQTKISLPSEIMFLRLRKTQV